MTGSGVTSTGGSVSTGGSKTTGGAPSSGGAGSTGGSKTTGGSPSTGGSKATGGTAHTGGAAAGGASASFVCNEVFGLNVASQWFLAGFETENGIVDSHWQIKYQHAAYVDLWADPSNAVWNAPMSSLCAQDSTSPDRIVFMVLSWNVWTEQQWQTHITAAVSAIYVKYPNVKRIDLITPVRCPGDQSCAPAVNGESCVMPAELDAAIAAVASQSPGTVFASSKFEAPDCSVFTGAGPDMTATGGATMANIISAYFSTSQ